jgi:hypothetical protein
MSRTDRHTEIAARATSDGSTASSHVSLEDVHSSIEVPHHQAGFWKQWRAFVGPAILVSVGYMDPGNWGTDLQGGARFKYGLLWVVGLASLMAIFMQMISARLGVVTGKDLAQCCRDWYPKWTRWPNWLMSEVAIGACDLAEVLGSAVALNLMFHIPLLWAVIITGLDVLLLLALQRFGMRTIEAIVLLLIATIGVCYFIEILVLPQTQPSFLEMGRALISPHFRQSRTAPASELQHWHRSYFRFPQERPVWGRVDLRLYLRKQRNPRFVLHRFRRAHRIRRGNEELQLAADKSRPRLHLDTERHYKLYRPDAGAEPA